MNRRSLLTLTLTLLLALAPLLRAEAPPATRQRVTLPICAITKQIASPRCPIVLNRTFDVGEAPTETCTRHARSTPGP